MPARDALHYQMIMLDDLSPGGLLGSILDGYERSQRGMPLPGEDDRRRLMPSADALPNAIGLFSPKIPYDESGDRLRMHFRRGLEMSLAYYVDPRMTALVTAAAESMPDEPLRQHDLPSSHGFLWLPSGMSEVDIRGQLMVHNAVAWFQRAGGIDLWFLTNKFDERDMVNLRQRQMFGDAMYAQMPTLSPAHYTRVEFGSTAPLSFGGTKVLPPEITDQLRVMKDPDSGGYAWAWPEGYDVQEWLESSIEVAPSATVIWMMACWRLMQQTITDIRTEPVDRPLRKAAEKRRMKSNTVTVITLRKRKRVAGEPEQEIEWSHRHLRRGHWRKTWVGPRDGDPEERYQVPVWIHPTIVLADREDLPLLVRDHVYSLER